MHATTASRLQGFQSVQDRIAQARGVLETLLHHDAVRANEMLGFAVEGVQHLLRDASATLSDATDAGVL